MAVSDRGGEFLFFNIPAKAWCLSRNISKKTPLDIAYGVVFFFVHGTSGGFGPGMVLMNNPEPPRVMQTLRGCHRCGGGGGGHSEKNSV